MMRMLSTAILALAVAGVSHGDDKKPLRDPLPREEQVKWDVTVLEDAPNYAVVKREVKGNKVTWVLENRRDLGVEITFGYQAALYDADGVKMGTIGIEVEPFLMNMPRGERNRMTLHLPQPEKWKEVGKVVIKNGEFNR